MKSFFTRLRRAWIPILTPIVLVLIALFGGEFFRMFKEFDAVLHAAGGVVCFWFFSTVTGRHMGWTWILSLSIFVLWEFVEFHWTKILEAGQYPGLKRQVLLFGDNFDTASDVLVAVVTGLAYLFFSREFRGSRRKK